MAFGRLTPGRAPRPMSEINVTPLVDVMLVLVVIFILAAPLLAGSLRLQLPQADGLEAPPPAARPLLLEVDAQGGVHWQGQALADDALASRLQLAARQTPDAEIALRADARVAYGRVLALIGMAQAAGLSRIAFAAEPAPAAPGRR